MRRVLTCVLSLLVAAAIAAPAPALGADEETADAASPASAPSLQDALTGSKTDDAFAASSASPLTIDADGAGQFAAAAAATEQWDDRFGYPGVASEVSAIAVDGDIVYVGGRFTSAGGLPIKYVAKWDGRRWQALGTGVNNIVTALAVDDEGRLYAGGEFTAAGGKTVKRLAMWDGAAWNNVGGGVSNANQYDTLYVNSLLADGDFLYVGGRFDRVGLGTVANSVARYDTAAQTWSTLSGGVTTCHGCGGTSPGTVWTMAKSGTTLYVGGYFEGAGGVAGYRSLAAWSGTAWSNVGGGVGSGAYSYGQVFSLAVDGTDLYVGGSFDRTTAEMLVSGLQKWNGTTWSNVGDGFGDGARTTYDSAGVVNGVAVTGGSVYIGGSFGQVDGAPATNFARYDGEVWQPANEPDGEINAVVPDGNGGVYVGGWYGALDTPVEVTVNNIARYDGAAWQAFGQGLAATGFAGGFVHAVTDGPDGVYAGGSFDHGGATATSAVARWDGAKWNPLGQGLVDGSYRGAVDALLTIGNDVYVAGKFTRAGGITTTNIARWNTLTDTWHPLGSGTAGRVKALTKIGGKLIAAGDFTHAGGVAANRIAVWDPATSKWSKMPGATALTFSDSINALTVVANRYLAVGGAFRYVTVNGGGTVDANALLLYDWRTSTWLSTDAAGSGVLKSSSYGTSTGWVYGMAASGNNLYVGGDFDAVGDEFSNNTIAARSVVRYNLDTLMWEPIGEVGGDYSVVRALGMYGSWLGVVGDFGTAGGLDSPGAAFYDTAGDSWTPLGSGLGLDDYTGNNGWSIAPAAGSLWVGGRFGTANGNPSHNIAAWSLPPLAAITSGPSGWVKSKSATFKVSAPAGSTKKCWLDGVRKSCAELSFTGLSQGVHELQVQATNQFGAGPIASRVWGVDTVAPTRSTTGPTAAFTVGTSTPVKWSGADASSGLASFDVRHRRAPYTGDFGAYTTMWSAVTVTNRNFTTLVPGYTYCFSSRARDVAGNVSAWSTEKCTAAPLDDVSLVTSAGWTRATGVPAFYRTTYTQTSTLNARLTRTGVQAKRIAIVATRCPTCGKVEIYRGTTMVATVSLYNGTSQNQWLSPAYVATGVSPTSTLSIKVISPSGKTVRIDGLAVSRQ